jgi:hypothetical protein
LTVLLGNIINLQSIFENWVVRRISVLKRDEIIEGWKKLHDEELQNLYS